MRSPDLPLQASKNIFWMGACYSDKYFSKVIRKLELEDRLYGYMSHTCASASILSKIVFVDSTFLYRLDHLEMAFPNNTWKFGREPNISSINEFRGEVYSAIDRISPIVKENAYKDIYFNKLSGYIIDFLETSPSIKLIISEHTPHMPWDILFCRVAKLFGIPTFSINRALPGYSMLWEDFGFHAKKYSGSLLKCDAQEDIRAALDSQIKKITAHADSFKKLPTCRIKVWLNRYLSNRLPFIWSLVNSVKVAFQPVCMQVYPASAQTFQSTTFAGEKNFSKLMYMRIWFSYYTRHISLVRYLDMQAEISPDTSIDYFYFGLHFQPERSTLPEGHIFRDQLLVIRMLAEAMPENYSLYVKEHPRQLSIDMRNYNYRSISFYEEISKIERVKLIHPSVSSKHLIGNSKLVSTVTGSAAIEGLMVGVPSILFAQNWHCECMSSPCYMKFDHHLSELIGKMLLKTRQEVYKDLDEFLNDPGFIHACASSKEWDQLGNDNIYVDNLAEVILGLNPQS